MHIYKTEKHCNYWIEKEEQLVSFIGEIEKAIDIITGITEGGRIMPIFVGNGVHDRDCGYMDFKGDFYGYNRGRWSEKLLEDYREQSKEIEDTWFSRVSIGEIDVSIVTHCGPVFLQINYLNINSIRMSIDFSSSYKEEEKEVIEKMSEAFEYGGQN